MSIGGSVGSGCAMSAGGGKFSCGPGLVGDGRGGGAIPFNVSVSF
jgi:hypothetical protein